MKTKRKNKYRRQIVYYTALKNPDESKLTPHACAIVGAIQSFNRPVARAELVEVLAKRLKRMGSKQTATRVISFHKKTLLAANFIRVSKKPLPTVTPVQEAPVVAGSPVFAGNVAVESPALEPVPTPAPTEPTPPAQEPTPPPSLEEIKAESLPPLDVT